jgi:hypothetical protein
MINQLIINAVMFFVTIITCFFIIRESHKNRFRAIENKLDIVWEYIYNRAKTEFLIKKMGTINSPIKVNDGVKEWYKPISHELRETYNKVGPNLTDKELFIHIHEKFGEWITKNICIPYKLESGACIIAAIAIAQEKD